MAVAVFEIHIDRNPVAIMNPRMIRFVFVPIMEIIVKAIRRCKFHFSMSKAIINPPMNKKIVSSPYDEGVAPMSRPSVNVNRMIASKDVAGIGIASVNHQIATHIVLAKTAKPCSDNPSGEKIDHVRIKDNGPA